MDRKITVTHTGLDLTSLTGKDLPAAVYSYDSHRLTGVAQGDGAGQTVFRNWEYDAESLIKSVTSGTAAETVRVLVAPASRNGLGAPVLGANWEKSTDAISNVERVLRDRRGNVLEARHADGTREQWTRNAAGFATSYTDPLGATTVYTLDADNDVTLVTLPAVPAFGATTVNTDYKLVTTESGRQAKVVERVTDQLGKATTLTYYSAADGPSAFFLLGKLSSVSDATGVTQYFDYDPATGFLYRTRNDAYQVVSTNVYDSLGRLETTLDADARPIVNVYDKNGNVATPSRRPRPRNEDRPGRPRPGRIPDPPRPGRLDDHVQRRGADRPDDRPDGH